MPQKLSGELALEYCKKWPNVPSLTLAKKLYKENKEVYLDIDHARGAIRLYRGQKGKALRGVVQDKSAFTESTGDTNPFKLPESKSIAENVFKLPSSIKKVLFLTDIHMPFHVVRAIEIACDDGDREGVDCIWVNGDALDFYQLSFHERDPRKISLSEELESGRQLFAYLRGRFPKAVIYFVPGNHEIRLERYLRIKAPELLNVDEFRLDVLLKLREHDIIFIPYGSKCYFGKLLVEHGDKLRGTGGVSPARTLANKFKRHCITGHWHRKDEYNSKIYDGESIVTYTVGCLCELEPAFMPVNEHVHGFAIIEMSGQEFRVHNKKISNGKVF